jgi:hypothetical protein
MAGVISDAVRQGGCLSSRSIAITKFSFRLGRVMGPIRQIIGADGFIMAIKEHVGTLLSGMDAVVQQVQ